MIEQGARKFGALGRIGDVIGERRAGEKDRALHCELQCVDRGEGA
jgi:hypothetical protein